MFGDDPFTLDANPNDPQKFWRDLMGNVAPAFQRPALGAAGDPFAGLRVPFAQTPDDRHAAPPAASAPVAASPGTWLGQQAAAPPDDGGGLSPKERAMRTILDLDANNVPTGTGTLLPPRTAATLPAPTPGNRLGDMAAYATPVVGSNVGRFAAMLGLPGQPQAPVPIPQAWRAGAAAPGVAGPVAPQPQTPAAPQPGGDLMRILDGFHGQDGLGAMTQQPTYGPLAPRQYGPGAGWGQNAAPGDDIWQRGMAPVPHIWTEADLDPTVVLGYTGSMRKGFAGGDTLGYTRQSPMMPLFAADMRNRALGLDAQQKAMEMLQHQLFQHNENDLNRQADLQRAQLTLDKSDHDKLLAMAFNPDTPPTIRNPAIDELLNKKVITKQRADENLIDMVMTSAARKSGSADPTTPAYLSQLAQAFDPERMNKALLIQRLVKAGATPDALRRVADQQAGWGIRQMTPAERSTQSFLNSLLQ